MAKRSIVGQFYDTRSGTRQERVHFAAICGPQLSFGGESVRWISFTKAPQHPTNLSGEY